MAADVGAREMGQEEKEIFHMAELYADKIDDSREITQKKRMARAARTKWKEETELFQNRVLQRESEMRSVMNEVYNLVGLYSVFMGVVLTAVATSGRLECPHLWSPVGLSLFAYFMLVVVAFTKFRQIRKLQLDNQQEKEISNDTSIWLFDLSDRGYGVFDFHTDCNHRTYRSLTDPFWKNALGLIVPLTIFTAGLVFSLVHILCWS